MSTEQHHADAYGQELARISHHQHEATAARFTVFQAPAAAGIGHEQADDIVAKQEAGAVAGAHTWISESSPPHKSEPQFEDGWFAGVRDVASYLLRIADTTAHAGRGRAAPAPCWSPTSSSQPPAPRRRRRRTNPPRPRCRRWRRRTSWRRRNASRGPWPRRGRATGRTGRTSWTSR
ncbi:hypothetical protein [Streptomyces sp. TP-A0874]|uniref:hypothetical protein n=1 Tax=Streptomyces sp. TP-A0874 TaxID=549819 RepID=UPI000853A959|nr:hypothetical protein [Streptomyces sp. TP-A0874]